jgi:bacterioferritin
MKGDPKVIEVLNAALKDELTAINQYFVHAEMCDNWGYKKLGEYIKKQSIDEMKHAEALLERILFLDGEPRMAETLPLTIGQDVPTQFKNDLKLETAAVATYNRYAKLCAEAGDNASRDLFVKLLRDEEGHVNWLETQLGLIEKLGLDNYLVEQI